VHSPAPRHEGEAEGALTRSTAWGWGWGCTHPLHGMRARLREHSPVPRHPHLTSTLAPRRGRKHRGARFSTRPRWVDSEN